MSEDYERMKDVSQVADLPQRQQVRLQLLALQQVILGLLAHLGDDIQTYVATREVDRDLKPTAVPTSATGRIHGAVPSPRQIKEMLQPEDVWSIDPTLHEHYERAAQKAAELAKLWLGIPEDDEQSRYDIHLSQLRRQTFTSVLISKELARTS